MSDHLPGFRHLWMRYVRDVRLDRHCIQTFVGKGDPRFHPRTTKIGDNAILDVERTPLIYLCGVTWRSYEDNLHIALTHEVGETFEIPTYNGYVVRGNGARVLPIPPLPDGWNGLGKDFTTCRNFQTSVAYQDLIRQGYKGELAPVIQIVPRSSS